MRFFSTRDKPNIASDLKLHEAFTLSYWAQIDSSNEKKRIMDVSMQNLGNIEIQLPYIICEKMI